MHQFAGHARLKDAKALLLLISLAIFGAVPAAGEQNHDHSAHQSMMMQPKRYTRVSATYSVPKTVLVDQDGRKTSVAELLNDTRPTALNFIFTTCTTICPVMTGTFAKMRKELGDDADDLRMLSITIDPEFDRPAVLKQYGAKFGAGANWQFLTGRSEDIVSVQRAFDAYTGEKTNHRPVTFLRGPGATQWVRVEGLASGTDLAAEYRMLRHNHH